MEVDTVKRGSWLVGQLPMGMTDDDFFVRFVGIFEELATSFLEAADNIPNVVDVSVAPAELVRWLGSWIGAASIDSSLPEDLQRRLVRRASENLAWRGTKDGLARFLEVVTGSPAEIEESGRITREGQSGNRPPFVRVRVQSIGWLPDDDFVSLVEDEIPANVTYELYAGDRRLWPPTDDGGAEP
jgi:phage tail-like protein